MAVHQESTDADLRTGHRQRLKKRFLEDPSAMEDADILELLLGCVYLRRDNHLLARRLTLRFPNIGSLLHASAEELAQIEGCGVPVHTFLLLLQEVIARSAQGSIQQKSSATLPELAVMGQKRLAHCSHEEVWGALLDKQNRLLNFKKIRHGLPCHVSLEPLEVVECMIRNQASSLVLMHNHPGGSCLPSSEDRELTGRIAAALRHLGLHLHDHLIITPDACFSILRDCRIVLT